MNDLSGIICRMPARRPVCPNFSSGPCKKHPGWDVTKLPTELMGRSHRSRSGKKRLSEAIARSRRLLGLPEEWVLAIVPGSGTGAIEFALWNLLGPRDVDVLKSDGFSGYWAHDVRQMVSRPVTVHEGGGTRFPDTSGVRPENDVVFVYNGTGNGVWAGNLDWIADDMEGLVIADAASAAFAIPLEFNKLDAVTWSWPKGLGSEAGHGMVALGPRALRRALDFAPQSVGPKLLSFCKADGTALLNLFDGHTISTPSLLALEDLHSALDWAEGQGGRDALFKRVTKNFETVDKWVKTTPWIEWLAEPDHRSPASLCLKIVLPQDQANARAICLTMIELLEQEGVAYDIFTMHDAPAGFRVWAGPTVEAEDLHCLTKWLEWACFTAVQHIWSRSGAGLFCDLPGYAGGADFDADIVALQVQGGLQLGHS